MKENEDRVVQPLLQRYLKEKRADTPSVLPIFSLLLCSRTLHQRLWVDTNEIHWKRLLWACGVSRPVEFEGHSWKSLAREFARHQKSECKGGICLAAEKEGMGDWFDMSLDGRCQKDWPRLLRYWGRSNVCLAISIKMLILQAVYPSMHQRALRCLKESQARRWSVGIALTGADGSYPS